VNKKICCKFFPTSVTGDTASWVDMVQTNILGYLHTMGVFLPMMKREGRGHVVNIGSTNSREPAAGMAVYSGSKAFWLGATPALRKELRGSGIKITQVEPGAVGTEKILNLMEDPSFQALHEKFYPRAIVDLDRFRNRERLRPKDIGEVVWNAIKAADRIYEQEIYIGNKE